MLHVKFHVHQPFGSGKADFKSFYLIRAWQPSGLCESDHLKELLFPRTMLI